MNFLMAVLGIVLAFILICIFRAIRGPSIWDRLLGLNLVTTKVIVIIGIFSSLNALPYLIDLALVYALIGFVGTIFTALFLMARVKEVRK